MIGVSWFWIAVAMTLPLAGGLLAAWPIWLTGQPILGNLAGSLVIFGSAIALIMRERTELDQLVQACLDAGTTCWPTPDAFTRFAVYAFIGLAEVIVVFLVSLRIETRQRRKGYSPEWR